MVDKHTESGESKFQPCELIQILPIGILRTDSAKRCVYCNPRWCQLAGITCEAAAGDGWLAAVHPEDRERLLAQWTTPPAEAAEFVAELRFQRPDGTVRHVSNHVLPFFDDGGACVGYLSAVTDLTERQKAEQALRELTTDLQNRVKGLNCLFAISHIVEAAAGSLVQILRETVELLPRSWEHSDVACARIVIGELDYRTENCAETPWKQAADILVHGEPVGYVAVGYLEERPPQFEGPFSTEERSLINIVAERLGHVAERFQAEQQVNEREQELRQRLTHVTRVNVMGEMASSIAHEVNQPLTAISTYAQACGRMIDARMTEGSMVREILESITEEALRAGGIIDRLRALVQKREDTRVDHDINDLIHSIECLAFVDARLHNVQLRFDLENNLPLVSVDGIQIQQVILNLIRNGIDAMEDTDVKHEEILVRTGHDDTKVQVSVTDYGCGLSQDAESKLFQPFFTTKSSGMGMGLSISRSIVNSHGGRIWFSRNPGCGSTFYFTIPVATGDDHGGE